MGGSEQPARVENGREPTRLLDEGAREPRIEPLMRTGLRWHTGGVGALGLQLVDPRLQAVASLV